MRRRSRPRQIRPVSFFDLIGNDFLRGQPRDTYVVPRGTLGPISARWPERPYCIIEAFNNLAPSNILPPATLDAKPHRCLPLYQSNRRMHFTHPLGGIQDPQSASRTHWVHPGPTGYIQEIKLYPWVRGYCCFPHPSPALHLGRSDTTLLKALMRCERCGLHPKSQEAEFEWERDRCILQ